MDLEEQVNFFKLELLSVELLGLRLPPVRDDLRVFCHFALLTRLIEGIVTELVTNGYALRQICYRFYFVKLCFQDGIIHMDDICQIHPAADDHGRS